MKYKGFIIHPVYLMDPDEYTQAPLDDYEILDPMNSNKRWMMKKTVFDCKYEIDRFLASVKMKDNKPASWKQLEGWEELPYFKGGGESEI